MEEAEAYQTLIERLGCTHEELAQQLGKSRSVITNSLRLLQLPIDIQRAVAEGRLTAGHARCLIGSDQPERWMSKILDGGWSVRRTEQAIQAERERMIRPARALPAGSPTEIAAPALLANLQDTKDPLPREWTCVADSSRGDVEQSDDAQMIVSSLADRLGGTRVTLHLAPTGQRGGALTLYYEHTHELDALLQVTAGWEHPSAALPLTVRKESTNELDA
jgi:ParB-like chromosome segregation protein Spo0J